MTLARKGNTSDPQIDTHLKTPDFFDVAKFPSVTFHATKIVQTGPKTARITGDLTLLGATHPVTLEAEFLGAGKRRLRQFSRPTIYWIDASTSRASSGVLETS